MQSLAATEKAAPCSLSQDLQSLSVNVTRLPPSVTTLVECVAYEIAVIEDELNQCYSGNLDNDNGQETIESLEDAIDDGFMCVDLKVLERKLQVWHRLFSPAFQNDPNEYNYTVTPFFAVKCNPDPLVVEWLARSSRSNNLPLGFDCASIAELELAKQNIEKYSLVSVSGSKQFTANGKQSAVPTTRIVYANPQRAEADLIKAMELFATTSAQPNSDLWLTLDGVEEVFKIAIAKERFRNKHQQALQMPSLKIILRIWVPDGHSQVPLGEKFGMRLDQIDSVIRACLEQNIQPSDIIGISFHCGSGCESVETYLEALDMGKKALQAMDKVLLEAGQSKESLAQHRCWLLDIGGGFPGLDGLYGDEGRFASMVTKSSAVANTATDAGPPQTTVANIGMAVRPVMQSFATVGSSSDPSQEAPLTLIAEPGRYFVEGAFALASKIYQKQIIPHQEPSTQNGGDASETIRIYRIPHGVQGVFKDVLLCGESFVPQSLQQNSSQQDPSEKKLYRSRVLGPSGDDSEDVVCDACWLPELEIGDWLVFDRMGAYTLSIASRAGRPIMRYVMGGEPEANDQPNAI